MKPKWVTIQMKAIEQYFQVVLFVVDNFAKLAELGTLGSERVLMGPSELFVQGVVLIIEVITPLCQL